MHSCTLHGVRDRRLTPSAQFAGPHPVNPLGDHNLRMLGIANLAAEDTGAALPAHRLAGTLSRAYRGRPRSGEPLGALACLPRLAAGQSLFAGHELLPGALLAQRPDLCLFALRLRRFCLTPRLSLAWSGGLGGGAHSARATGIAATGRCRGLSGAQPRLD